MAPKVQVTPSEVDEMSNLVNYDLFGPTGAVWNLPAGQRDIMVSGKPGAAKPKVAIWVQDSATQLDKDLVHAGPDDHLLGLYTSGDERFDGKPTVQIFADACVATGTSPSDVAIHEMGHVLEFNHSSRVGIVENHGAAYTVCADCEPRVAAHMGSGVWSRDPDCPLCLLCIDTAVILANCNDVKIRAHLQHQIPLGLGGLIVETRNWVTDAQTQLTEGAALVPWMGPSLAACGGFLNQLSTMLSGMQTPESMSKAYEVAYRARDAAVDITHAYFLAEFHGGDAAGAPNP
jgi:hypothetical protein